MCMKIVLLRASASQKFNSTLFYYPEKPLYYYTIPFYNTFNIPNFYFTIQHIKIIFLRNKIIYPKNQIKIKTQITSTTYCHHHHHHHHEEHTQTETHGHATTPRQPQKSQPQNPWPPPSPRQPLTFTTMNPHMTHNKNPTPFHHHHHHDNPQHHHHEPTKKKFIPKSNQTNSKFQIHKMTHTKKSSHNLHKPSYKPISPLQTTPEIPRNRRCKPKIPRNCHHTTLI